MLDEADEPTQWDSDLPNDLAGWAERLADAEFKRRMREVPQPRGDAAAAVSSRSEDGEPAAMIGIEQGKL